MQTNREKSGSIANIPSVRLVMCVIPERSPQLELILEPLGPGWLIDGVSLSPGSQTVINGAGSFVESSRACHGLSLWSEVVLVPVA
jgi:hypothetical protein